MNRILSAPVVADLPPPPPFSLFSGDVPHVAASIAIIFLGVAATSLALWFAFKRRPTAKNDR